MTHGRFLIPLVVVTAATSWLCLRGGVPCRPPASGVPVVPDAASRAAAGAVIAAAPGPGNSAADALESFTGWWRVYREMPKDARDAARAAGLRLARARRAEMAALIRTDPERALALSVPLAARAELPPEIEAELETIVSGVGFYGVKAICNHGPDAAHGTRCRIEPEVAISGQLYKAAIYGARRTKLTDERAALYGVALDGWIALQEKEGVAP